MKPGLLLPLAALTLCGCDNMQHQENVRTMTRSDHFSNDASARTAPAHTVDRQGLGASEPGLSPTLTRALLERGQAMYNADCATCHGADGYGRGIVVRRGFPAPASLHTPAMRQLSESQVVGVIRDGHGIMYPMGDRIQRPDRWAIAAYVQVLQASQSTPFADLTDAEKGQLATP